MVLQGAVVANPDSKIKFTLNKINFKLHKHKQKQVKEEAAKTEDIKLQLEEISKTQTVEQNVNDKQLGYL